MNENQLFILLQVNDAQFPIGGYSHSYGLETYIQKNIVKDPESAFAFLESSIMNSFLYSELLPARLAYEYAKAGDLDKILELEEIVVKEEERKASGRSAFLQVMQKQPVKTAAVAVSGALLCSVLALLCFLLLMGVRVYTEDENGRYRLLGMRICRRQEEDLYVLLPVKMTEKSETDRYRLCPGWLFAFLNKEETMIIESAQNQSRISVKVSGKMEFRL